MRNLWGVHFLELHTQFFKCVRFSVRRVHSIQQTPTVTHGAKSSEPQTTCHLLSQCQPALGCHGYSYSRPRRDAAGPLEDLNPEMASSNQTQDITCVPSVEKEMWDGRVQGGRTGPRLESESQHGDRVNKTKAGVERSWRTTYTLGMQV